ncbi:MAG: NAD(P)H-binding protein [Paracoccaceae bacterium]
MTTTNTIPAPRRVFLLGGTGTIGRATARALRAAGHEVVAMVRPRPDTATLLPGVELREGDPTEAASLARDGLRGERFDTLISCLASRSGAPADAWAIEHDAQLAALRMAESAGIGHMILLSAICVQKPLLEFQRAKLAFEAALQGSAIDWTIVRPTAFFKSLSGQVARVRDGKPYLLFGDGKLTACTPIHDDDLGAFLARCVTDPEARNRILPIGGPGPALTPLEMGQMLFELTGRPPRSIWPISALSPGTGGDDGCDRGRSGLSGPILAPDGGQGRIRPDRALLRHRVDAAVEPRDRALRRSGHAGLRQPPPARPLRRDAARRGGRRPRRTRDLLGPSPPVPDRMLSKSPVPVYGPPHIRDVTH